MWALQNNFLQKSTLWKGGRKDYSYAMKKPDKHYLRCSTSISIVKHHFGNTVPFCEAMKIAVYICDFPAQKPVTPIQSFLKNQILIEVPCLYHSEL
jgi:hypothetical protein